MSIQQTTLRRDTDPSPLLAALALLRATRESGDRSVRRRAFETLCQLWTQHPVAHLADAIERLARHVESDAARALRAHDGRRADDALWHQLCADPEPWDLCALADTALVADLDRAVARATALADCFARHRRLCSPCLTGPLLRWLERPVFSAPASRPIFAAALDILEQAGDPRALDLVRRLENTNVSLGKPLAAWLDGRLVSLRARLAGAGLDRWLALDAVNGLARPLASLELAIDELDALASSEPGVRADDPVELCGAPIELPDTAVPLVDIQLADEALLLPAAHSALLATSPGGERLALLVRPTLCGGPTEGCAVHIVDRDGTTLTIAPTPDWQTSAGVPGPAALSRDGRTLSSAIDDGIAWLEVDTGRRGRVALTDSGDVATGRQRVDGLDVAHDGRFAAVLATPSSGDATSTLSEIERETGATVRTHALAHRHEAHGIAAVRYSPSGRWVACICDALLFILDRERDELQRVESPSGTWYDLTWLTEPEHLAAIDHNGRVQVVEPVTATPVRTLERPACPEPPTAFTRIGAPIALFADATAGLTTIQPHHAAYGDTSRVADVRVHSADALGAGFGPAQTLELGHGVETTAGSAMTMTWDAQRDELVVADAEHGRVCWWRPGETASPSHVIERFAHCVRGLSCATDATGAELVVGRYGARVCLWRDGTLLDTLDAPGAVQDAAVVPGARLVVVGMDHGLRLWHPRSDVDAEPGATRALHGLSGTVEALAVSPDGQLVAAGTDDGTVCVWEVESGALVESRAVGSGRLCALAFHPRGGVLAAVDTSGEVAVWDPRSPTRGARVPVGVSSAVGLAWSADGQRVVVASSERLVWVDPGGLCVAFELPLEVAGTSFAAHPGRDLFVVGDAHGRVWSIGAERVATIVATEHVAPVAALAFGRDDALLVGAAHRGRHGSVVRWVRAPHAAA